MKKEETSWTKGVFLICTKCNKAIDPAILSEEGNCAENLKMYLKKALKEKGEEKQVRVMTSSCLDVCVDNLQAVSYIGKDGTTESWTMHPENERGEMLSYIRENLQK